MWEASSNIFLGIQRAISFSVEENPQYDLEQVSTCCPSQSHIVDVKTKLTLTVCKRRNILHFDVRITLHWWWNYKWPANNVHFELECRNHHLPNCQIAIINCKWNLRWTILDRNVKFWGGKTIFGKHKKKTALKKFEAVGSVSQRFQKGRPRFDLQPIMM